ncbi:MAG: NUDIX hydrolase [Planctomycetota bacterium]|jgi:phosphohistidine phosphatase
MGNGFTSQSTLIEQACVIPFRQRDERTEFCLITSSRKQRWVFPKGIIEYDETPAEAALREAFEEAGIRGRVIGKPLGVYEAAKWGSDCRITVLLMEVKRADKFWLEDDVRERCWVIYEKAKKLDLRPEHQEMLKIANKRLSKM